MGLKQSSFNVPRCPLFGAHRRSHSHWSMLHFHTDNGASINGSISLDWSISYSTIKLARGMIIKAHFRLPLLSIRRKAYRLVLSHIPFSVIIPPLTAMMMYLDGSAGRDGSVGAIADAITVVGIQLLSALSVRWALLVVTDVDWSMLEREPHHMEARLTAKASWVNAAVTPDKESTEDWLRQ